MFLSTSPLDLSLLQIANCSPIDEIPLNPLLLISTLFARDIHDTLLPLPLLKLILESFIGLLQLSSFELCSFSFSFHGDFDEKPLNPPLLAPIEDLSPDFAAEGGFEKPLRS